MKFDKYLLCDSIGEAYEAIQKPRTIILAGMGWSKMARRNYSTAVDLSALGLNKITESETAFHIGAMVSLRELETNEALNNASNNAFRHSVEHIVGTQFRRGATVGGSVWGRFGFSDVITVLMAMDADVVLHNGGIIPLREFAHQPKSKDILIEVIVEKSRMNTVYTSFRNTETDFPVITCAVSKSDQGFCCAIGARPYVARQVLAETPEGLISKIQQLSYGTNLRGSAEYRKHLAQTLAKRCLCELEANV